MSDEIQPTSTQPQSPPGEAMTLEQREKDLSDRVARFDAQVAQRDAVVRELAERQAKLTKLDEEIIAKRQEIAKPPSAASGAQQAGKLEYFEAEVRRLESKLTQQKVSYERQVKNLQEKLDGQPNNDPMQEFMGLDDALEIDKLADAINNEISGLAFGMKPNYDWRILELVQTAVKLMSENLDRTLLPSTSSVDQNARTAFSKLDTRLNLCTGQLQKLLVAKPSSGGVQFPDALLKQMNTHAQTSVDLLAKTEIQVESAEELQRLRQNIEESLESGAQILCSFTKCCDEAQFEPLGKFGEGMSAMINCMREAVGAVEAHMKSLGPSFVTTGSAGKTQYMSDDDMATMQRLKEGMEQDLSAMNNARLHPGKAEQLAEACKNAVGDMHAAYTIMQKIVAESNENSGDGSRDTSRFKNLDDMVKVVKAELEKTIELMTSGSQTSTTSQTEMDKLKRRVAQIETDLEEKDQALLENEKQMLQLTDQVEDQQKVGEGLRQRIASYIDRELKHEENKEKLLKQISEHVTMIEELQSLKSQADEENIKLQELLTEADNQLRQVEQRIGPLEQENEAMQQRFQQNEILVASVKKDFQQILNYKTDLEVLIEDQTQHLENKNQRLYQLEEQRSLKDNEIENLESQVRRQTALADESRKKLLQAEVKIRQLTQATLKDLKAKIKDKNAEIEVLKEMVKSANMQAKSKDIDVSRLKKKINRLQKDGGDAGSNYGGSRRGREDGSVSSRQSRLNNGVSPNHPNMGAGLDGVIHERDAELEQTGAYDYHTQANSMPKMTKTKQQEWEEAVELDRILERERDSTSKQVLHSRQEDNYNEYMDRLQNPNTKNMSSGLSGILGGSSPYMNQAMGSLPDLKQSKRESLEAELLSGQGSGSGHANTVGRNVRGRGANGSLGVNSNRSRF